jgi:hypothetical protein
MDSIQQDDPLHSEMEISPGEREQVLKQIETAIAESRTPPEFDLAIIKAEKKGTLFPFLINLAALVLVAAGVLFLFRYFELRKESITLRHTAYLSAEGTLIQTLKRETESRLQTKEEEIASIRTKLLKVDEEREALKRELEAELETREAELREDLAGQLSRERERLLALGTSEAGIADHLRELESRQQDSIDREIAEYRQQLDAQLRLSELNARMQEENLLRDQSAAVFARLQDHLQEQRFAVALQDLESLEKNPIVQPYIVDLLRQLIQSNRNQSPPAQAAEDRAGQSAESAELEAVRTELAAKTGRIEELEEQVRTIVEASSSDRSAEAMLARQLQGRVDSLSAELKASEAQVKRLRAQLQSMRAERDELSVSLQSAQTGQSTAFEQGRDDALRDVMTFLRFLSRGEENSRDTEQQLVALTRQDPLFRAAAREIQILIAGGGSQGELASPFLFLGIVSSVASDRAVIEAMVDLDVSVGSDIQIRRITELDREITIAEGTVQQVRGTKLTASFKPVSSAGQGPKARDPVYLVLEDK